MVNSRLLKLSSTVLLGWACNVVLGNEEAHLVPGDGGSSGMGANAGKGGTSGGKGGSSNGGSTDGGGSDGGGPDAGASSSNAGTSSGGGPDGGTTSSGGSPDGGTNTGEGGMSGGGPEGGAGGTGGTINDVVPSAGCGLDPGQVLGSFVNYDMSTSGTKDADATGDPGPWQFDRDYYVRLPSGYDETIAYPVVFQGPGCGGNGTMVYQLTDIQEQVIRVGLTPPPSGINHAVAPGAGCFDDYEGDDSVDFVFYENLVDWLDTRFCMDRNRVFVSGNSTGGTISNHIGCQYAGHPTYPIRAIGVNTGGLQTDPNYRPTCSDAPMAGIWVHSTGDSTNPFAGNIVAINRAMDVNGCTIGTDYATATFENYPIGGGQPDTTCRKILGCPALFPLVVCALNLGDEHGSHDSVVNPGFATFFSDFFAP